jgi:hypothetical protein
MWLFALARLGDLKPEYRERGIALAKDIHSAFVIPGRGVIWKMKEDLSGPYPGYGLGSMDAYDGYVGYRLLNASASPLRSERGPLLCAPLPHSLRIDGLTGTNDAIDCMTLKQLRAGILERCFPGRLTMSHVALIDCTMQHPFRHFFSRSPRTIRGIYANSRRRASRRSTQKENPPL